MYSFLEMDKYFQFERLCFSQCWSACPNDERLIWDRWTAQTSNSYLLLPSVYQVVKGYLRRVHLVVHLRPCVQFPCWIEATLVTQDMLPTFTLKFNLDSTFNVPHLYKRTHLRMFRHSISGNKWTGSSKQIAQRRTLFGSAFAFKVKGKRHRFSILNYVLTYLSSPRVHSIALVRSADYSPYIFLGSKRGWRFSLFKYGYVSSYTTRSLVTQNETCQFSTN